MFKKIDENTIEETKEVKRKYRIDDILRQKKTVKERIERCKEEIAKLDALLEEAEKLGIEIEDKK